MMAELLLDPSSTPFHAVYGPVSSWRFGRSLGIDPIGAISTCSFDCVYCQLGEIERKTSARQVFIPTAQIQQELLAGLPWAADVVTFSGSGEPTLAANLGELLAIAKTITGLPTVVLTNATLLGDPGVRAELQRADIVAVKCDGASEAQIRRVDRPVTGMDWQMLQQGMLAFRQTYRGRFTVQTMVLSRWSASDCDAFIAWMRALAPDEIQLNTPTRPRPLRHELAARGNAPQGAALPYDTKPLKPVASEVLRSLAHHIEVETGIVVRCPPQIVPAVEAMANNP